MDLTSQDSGTVARAVVYEPLGWQLASQSLPSASPKPSGEICVRKDIWHKIQNQIVIRVICCGYPEREQPK